MLILLFSIFSCRTIIINRKVMMFFYSCSKFTLEARKIKYAIWLAGNNEKCYLACLLNGDWVKCFLHFQNIYLNQLMNKTILGRVLKVLEN